MTRLLCSICSVLALTASMAVHAQLRDIRLAPELRDYSLPQEAQVQSVASIGNRSLVAWASTTFDPDSNIINVLWMRLLDGSTPLLENRILHSPQARPYGFVLVIASADQFLIFFNDRRSDAPGTYVQRVDFNGNRIGTEQRIDIGAVKNDTINKPKSEVSALTYSWLPGWTFVQVDSARPFVVRDNAVVDTRPLAIDHMQGAYYLAEDTSVAVLKEEEVWLYNSLFDTEPQQRITVPELHQAIRNSEVLTHDSSGHYRLVYAAISDWKTYASTYWSIHIDSNGATTATALFSDVVPYSIPYYYNGPPLPFRNYGAIRQRSCDNAYRITVRYLGWSYYDNKGQVIPVALDSLPATTDFQTDGSYVHAFNHGSSPLATCSVSPVTVVRQIDNQSTRVELHLSSGTFKIDSSAALIHNSISRFHPNLFLDSTELIITWSLKGDNHRSQSGSWNVDSKIQPLTFFSPLTFGSAPLNPQADLMGLNQSSENAIHLYGRTVAYSSQHRSDSIRYGSYSTFPVETSYLDIRILTSRGWFPIHTETGYGTSSWRGGSDDTAAPWFSITMLGYDPYTHVFLFHTSSSIWNYESNTYMPGSNGIYSFGSKPKDALGLAMIWKPNHQRLSPDRWLRWHLADDSTRWVFDVVDTAGTIYHSCTLLLDGDPRSIFVTQNYPDRSTAVIWGGIGGVRGTFLSHSLDILQENVQISQTRDSVSYPSAAYRNDTLFVAWEDYRNGGIADVYGAAFTGAPMASSVEIAQNEIVHQQELHIWPNPAHDHLRITLPQHSEAASLEILDALGRLHSYVDIPAGAIAHELDLRTLEPGVYIARLSGSTPSHSIRFVVTH